MMALKKDKKIGLQERMSRPILRSAHYEENSRPMAQKRQRDGREQHLQS